MTREEIIEKLKAMEPELRARGITRMQMFGSRARGDNREDSDLDLLVDIDPSLPLSLLDVSEIRLDVSDRLGVDAYLMEQRSLEKRFKSRISDDLLAIFG
jgi:predicted nucleotidyltransferase